MFLIFSKSKDRKGLIIGKSNGYIDQIDTSELIFQL